MCDPIYKKFVAERELCIAVYIFKNAFQNYKTDKKFYAASSVIDWKSNAADDAFSG